MRIVPRVLVFKKKKIPLKTRVVEPMIYLSNGHGMVMCACHCEMDDEQSPVYLSRIYPGLLC